MKKNGFTLIEIIGAIVILGIIAIIAFSTYTASLKEFRENYYTREIKALENSAKEFFEDNRNYRPTKILNAQEVNLSTLETKEYVNDFVDYNGDTCSGSSYVIVVKEGVNDYSYHGCLICDKDGFDNTQNDTYCDKTWLDPTKVEYGIGDLDVAYIYKGTSREELRNELELPVAYVRKDDNGNVLASRRGTKEGNETMFPVNMDDVDTSKVGTYQATYRYGNEEKDRVVKVYENGAPNITYQRENTIVKNMKGDTKKDKKTYTDGEWAQNVIVSLSAKTYVDRSLSTKSFQWNLDGRWQDFCETDPCEITITKEMNQQVQFRVLDSKGHVSLLTDPITLRIDNTKPRCTLKIPTTIGENNWYNTDVDIEFNVLVDQKTGSSDLVVSGVNNYNIQKSTETLNTTLKVNSKTQTDDTAGITYKGYVEDLAKNFGMCEITFKKDATDPQCTKGGESTTWSNVNKTVTYGCKDTLSKCAEGHSGGSLLVNETKQKVVTPSYKIKDNAGNTITCPSKELNVYVDKTDPLCKVKGDSTNWVNQDRKITYYCEDADSGCATGFTGGSKTFTSTTKTYKLDDYTIRDKAGNEVPCTGPTVNVYVDKTAPTCNTRGESTDWTKSDRTIEFICEDSHSGCVKEVVNSKTYDKTTKTTTSTKYTIQDKAGNTNECDAKSINVYVDKTKPSCYIAGASTEWTKNDRTIKSTCVDDHSKCVKDIVAQITVSDTKQKVTISKYTISDKAGNTEVCEAREVDAYVDKTKPTCKITGTSTDWTKDDRVINSACEDSHSKCVKDVVTKTTVSETKQKVTISKYTIQDKAGNTEVCEAREVDAYVDKTIPTCKISGTSTIWTTDDRTISYNCEDTDSGCATGFTGGSVKFNTTTKIGSIGPYEIKDKAGNTKTCDKVDVNVYVGKPITCSAGYYLNKANCEICPAGKYCPGGTFNYNETVQGLKNCPSGYTNGGTGKSAESQCVKSVACGKYVETAKGAEKSCNAGYYKGQHDVTYGNTSACAKADAGYYVANSGSCSQTACESGTTSDGGATSCYAVCQQSEKEQICGGYCSDSEITYYKDNNQTVYEASPWTYYDDNLVAIGPQAIPEGRCIIKTLPTGVQACYVFQFFHSCTTGVTPNEITGSIWYSTWENSYGIQSGYNRIQVNAHFKSKTKPHCADYYEFPASPKCS